MRKEIYVEDFPFDEGDLTKEKAYTNQPTIIMASKVIKEKEFKNMDGETECAYIGDYVISAWDGTFIIPKEQFEEKYGITQIYILNIETDEDIKVTMTHSDPQTIKEAIKYFNECVPNCMGFYEVKK